MKRYIKYIMVAFVALNFFSACEDPIDVPSDFENAQLVVDAWLTNTNMPQTITLSGSIDYFAGGTPPPINGATVSVCNESQANCFTFEDQGNGRYVWQPGADETFGSVGDNFTLSIQVDGVEYSSATQIRRTVVIDSIGFEFEEESPIFDEGYYGQVYAFDLPGRGDTYWIRAYKNDTLLNRPEELTIAFDATFDGGADIDGTYFIPPLRASINSLDDDGATVPYQIGDKVYVEVHSISLEAFRFLNIAAEQITNEGIFAIPAANAPGNVQNTSNGTAALGIFNIAEVASLERVLQE